MPDVITLGEPLVEFIDKHKRGAFTELSEFIGPFPSGAPAIFADAVARLKVSSALIGVVGKDEFGTLLLDRLRNDGVDISHIRIAENYTTGTAFVTYSPSGSRKFIFHLRHAAAGQLSPRDADEEFIKSAKVLHIMGSALSLSQSSKEACYKALEIAVEYGIKISLDPNVRPELLSVEEIRRICKPVLEKAYLVLPSGEEAMMLTGGKSPDEACRMLIDMGVKMVALKRGGIR
ncbi:sugar kinase, partial [Candidatus Bathyarchaeota archaeon]|nr:sugar kinase [Candidatus Bathyarchaeota archaeon]